MLTEFVVIGPTNIAARITTHKSKDSALSSTTLVLTLNETSEIRIVAKGDYFIDEFLTTLTNAINEAKEKAVNVI